MEELTTTSTAPARRASATVDVRLDHYAIEPTSLTAPAGTVTLSADNVDRVPHDVTLIRTLLSPDRLPTTGIRIDEASPAMTVLARTPQLAPGASASVTTSLTPGTYVLVCTVPHHYVREAMVGKLTVSG